MFLKLGYYAGLLLLLPVAWAEDGGVSITDMDLLSGIPTVLVAVIAFIQILPSPVKVFQWRIRHFVEWLSNAVETDFGISLHTCSRNCHTYMYNGTEKATASRIQANIGSESATGCMEADLLTFEDVIGVVQQGSGESLVWLARLCGYPHVGRLETAVRVIKYAPLVGRRVIIWQWSAMSLPYLCSWLFRHGLPRLVYSFFLVLRNLFRRALAKLPNEYPKLTVNYRMAQLAQHKTLDQHAPFVRYALYFVLMELAGKSVSIRSFRDMLKPGDSGVHRPAWAADDVEWRQGNEAEFRRAAVASRRVAQRIATDECSAARLMFSFCLHSIRVMALCHGGFAPAYVTSGSFSAVECWVEDTLLIISHSTIDAVYQRMLKISARAHYNVLLKRLQSPLGDHLLQKRECIVLLNMALMPLNISALDSKSNPEKVFEVAGKGIERRLFEKLCRAQCDLFVQLNDDILPLFLKPDIYWGPQLWLLSILRKSMTSSAELDSAMELSTKLKMLAFSLFQPRFTSEKSSDRFYSLHALFGVSNELDEERFCRSMPAWCICDGHCRGICTLIVNELELNIMVESYCYRPYVFTAFADPVSPCESPAANTSDANGTNDANDANNPVASTSNSPIDHISNAADPAEAESPNISECIPQQHANEEDSSDIDSYSIVQSQPAPTNVPSEALPASRGVSTIRLICINNWTELDRSQFGKHLANPGNSEPARRFDMTHYLLSTLLYRDKPLVVAIRGNQLFVSNVSQPDNSKWPYADYMSDMKENVRKGQSVCVEKAHHLVLDSVDPVALLASRRAYMSYGRLNFEQSSDMKNRMENQVISIPVFDQLRDADKSLLLLRLQPKSRLLSDIELFMNQTSFQDNQEEDTAVSSMVVCDMSVPDSFADESESPEHSHVFVLGRAGCGKTRLLDEIVVRGIHKFSHMRVVQLDYTTWSQMDPEDALVHLATQLKLAFIDEKSFEQVMRLEVRTTTTTHLLCEQMLVAVQEFCQLAEHGLKVMFVVDNYKFPDMSSGKPCLAQSFMQMVDKFKRSFYVVAAVADPQGLPANVNTYELRSEMTSTEAEVLVSGVLVSSHDHALTKLLSNNRKGVIRVVRQYTRLNPHEMAMLFKYVRDTHISDKMLLTDFAHLARQFVDSGDDPRYPLKLGSMETTLHDITYRYDHLIDTVDLVKETVIRAYFNLQAKVPLGSTSKVFQQSSLNHHPFVSLEHIAGSSGMQFTSPRVAEYVLKRVFETSSVLQEASRRLKTSDHDRYEMAYIASRWLSKTQSRGMPIFEHHCRSTLYKLNKKKPEESCIELGWLSQSYGDVLGKVSSVMAYSQASHEQALNRTKGLDFIYQLCNGQDASQYVVLAMMQSEKMIRDIIDIWETNVYLYNGSKRNVKLTPFRRVLAGISQAKVVRQMLPGNQSMQPLKLHLLCVQSTTESLNTCKIRDVYGRYHINVVDVSSLPGLKGLNIRQFI
ncbi:hypothetical protein EV183_002620 [Coemansia sp. RSA 2336]|nr:hypothetical protein EV183_002620 [Coemansia sp. RSA 2336]